MVKRVMVLNTSPCPQARDTATSIQRISPDIGKGDKFTRTVKRKVLQAHLDVTHVASPNSPCEAGRISCQGLMPMDCMVA